MVKDGCITLITEICLYSLILDSAIKLAAYTIQCQDRTRDPSKSTGGGLCVHVSNNWCTNTVTVDRAYFPDLEYITVKCRPVCLPKQFTMVMITAFLTVHFTGCLRYLSYRKLP